MHLKPVRPSRAGVAAVAVVVAACAVVVPASAAGAAGGRSPADDGCSTAGDLTTLTSDGNVQNRSASGFESMAFDASTGVAYVPHFLGASNVITSYRPSTKTVLQCAVPVGTDKSNSHNGVNVNVDSEGYLQIVVGRHGTPPLYKRSAQPHDPTLSGGLVEPPSLVNDQLPLPGATYPQIYSDPTDANRLIVLARQHLSPGNPEVEITTSDDHGDTWTPAQTIVDFSATEPAAKVYPELVVAPDGVLHLVFTPHREVVPGQCTTYDNTDIYYATSSDFGQTWTKADGTPIDLPMTPDTADRVVAAASPDQRIQAKLGTPIAFDAQNRPIIFYRQWSDSTCSHPDTIPAKLKEVRWNGTAWTTPTVVSSVRAHTGYLVEQLNPDHNVIEVYATRIYGDVAILVVYRSTDYGVTWNPVECLDDEPTASLVTWQSDNQTQSDEDLVEFGSGTAGYLLDRTDSSGDVACPTN